MALLKFFAVLVLASVAVANVVKVGEVSVKKEVVTTVKDIVTDIAVDSKTGAVIFVEVVPGHEDQYTLNVYKPGHDGYKHIEGFKGHPQGVTINEDKEQVYFATTEGLYKISKATKTPELILEDGKDVINVQYRDNVLYYAISDEFKPRKAVKVNGEIKIEDINIDYADGLIVDSEHNIYYADKNRQFQKRPHGKSESVAIKGLEGKEITATTVGPDDGIYIAAGKETFVLRKGQTEVHTPLRQAKDTVTAAYVDKNKVTYVAEGHTIYKYTRQE